MTAQPSPDLHLVAVAFGKRGPSGAVERQCRVCRETRPLGAFRKRSDRPSSFTICRSCEQERDRRRVRPSEAREQHAPATPWPTALFDLQREEWQQRAACRGVGADKFWPGRGATFEVRELKAMCGSCPVSADCLDYADRAIPIEAGGIWGGLSARQRRERRRQMNREAAS